MSSNTAVASAEPASPGGDEPAAARAATPSATSAGAASSVHHSGSEVSMRSSSPGKCLAEPRLQGSSSKILPVGAAS